MTNIEVEALNAAFNEQLQQQIDGTLQRGHVYSLGNPSDVLIAAGIPDLPIEMASRRLIDKSLAIEANRTRGRMKVNSVRSVHYKDNNLNIVNWINDNLADYIRPDFFKDWFEPMKNELLSKPQSNSVDVRKQLISAAKLIEKFELAMDSGE